MSPGRKPITSSYCVRDLKPQRERKTRWPFLSGTRAEGPADRGGAGRSPGRTGTGANGLLWGSEVEVSGCRPGWPAPPSPHCPLQETQKMICLMIYINCMLGICVISNTISNVCTLLVTVQINNLFKRNSHGVVPVHAATQKMKQDVR